METKTQTQVEKRSYKEFEQEYIALDKHIKEFLDKHGHVVCGIKTQLNASANFGHGASVQLIFNDPLQNEIYE